MIKTKDVDFSEVAEKVNETQNSKIQKIEDKRLTAEEVFNLMELQFDPKFSNEKIFEDALNLFSDKVSSNFSGGCGDPMTLHEKMFYFLHPYLKPQVTYGTGIGGYKKYGFNRVIVDFYHQKENMAIEIDGDNHSLELQSIKDKIKELFLEIEHGITTIRFTNKEVEEMTMNKLKELERRDLLHLLVKGDEE